MIGFLAANADAVSPVDPCVALDQLVQIPFMPIASGTQDMKTDGGINARKISHTMIKPAVAPIFSEGFMIEFSKAMWLLILIN